MRIYKKDLQEHNPVLVFETSFEEYSWEEFALNIAAQNVQYFWASTFNGVYMFELCSSDNPTLFNEKANALIEELNSRLGTEYSLEDSA